MKELSLFFLRAYDLKLYFSVSMTIWILGNCCAAVDLLICI